MLTLQNAQIYLSSISKLQLFISPDAKVFTTPLARKSSSLSVQPVVGSIATHVPGLSSKGHAPRLKHIPTYGISTGENC